MVERKVKGGGLCYSVKKILYSLRNLFTVGSQASSDKTSKSVQADNQCHKNKHIWNHQEPQPIAVPLLGDYYLKNKKIEHDLDYEFVGRDLLINDILTILNETAETRGCYLISGFRGSGKTTLINKVLSFYKRGITYPTWLPKPHKSNNVSGYNKIINRGYRKLKATLIRAQSGIDISSCFISTQNPLFKHPRRRKKSRLVTVKVNLGHDSPLSPKDVMCNIGTLLYKKIKKEYRFTSIKIAILLALLSTTLFYGLLYFLKNIQDFSEWISLVPIYLTLKSWLHLPPGSTTFIGLVLFFAIALVIWYHIWTRYLATVAKVLRSLNQLNKRMVDTVALNKGVSNLGISLGQKITMPPLDARQIENDLLSILKACRKVSLGRKPDVIFVFDELDKIAHLPHQTQTNVPAQQSIGDDVRERKTKIDYLLGALKNFITHGKARFFFIAGRETLDSYQAERGSTSSLYESLFSRIFEVTSLLTDNSDHNNQRIHSLLELYVCRKIIDPDIAIYLWLQYTHKHSKDDPCWEEDLPRKLLYSPFCLRTYYHFLHFVGIEGSEARRIILGLRNFIQFLTVHSWGNPKRLQSLFLHFTKPFENVDWRQIENVQKITGRSNTVKTALQFGLIDQQRIVLASNLYSQLYHDLGRQLANSGDKLAVSTMAALQYILKFHRYPFNRYHLERMSETLSIYRSPELNTMIDSLVTKVLSQQIRRIRNSHYRYRFNGNFEQEMRYISRVSDIESAAFNFSLDAGAQTKAHYIQQLKEMIGAQENTCKNDVSIHDLCMTLGDLLAVEQSYDEALKYYQKAVDIFEGCDEQRYVRLAHLRVEALLRLGDMFERRERYDRAASVYIEACQTVKKLGRVPGGQHDALEIADSKWDVFRQPYWAYMFLHLKRSSIPWQAKNFQPFDYPMGKDEDAVNSYRQGQLAFFNAKHIEATRCFIETIKLTITEIGNDCSERDAYLGSYACLHLGENLFVTLMRRISELSKNNISLFLKCLIEQLEEHKCDSLDKLSESFSQTGYLKNLEEQSKNDQPLDVKVFHTIRLMIFAAETLESHGLSYHASIAYLKILSIWGMISEIFVALYPIATTIATNEIKTQKYLSFHKGMLTKSNAWVEELRKKAAGDITFLTAGGYSRFQARWRSRDVASIFNEDEESEESNFQKESSIDENQKRVEIIGQSKISNNLDSTWDNLKNYFSVPTKQNFILKNSHTIGYELGKTLDVIFPQMDTLKTIRKQLLIEVKELREALSNFNPRSEVDLNTLTKKLVDKKVFDKIEFDEFISDLKYYEKEADREKCKERFIRQARDPVMYLWRNTRESSFTQRSLLGQNLIYLSIWEYINSHQLKSLSKPSILPHHTMVPHSTRGLMFAHWLTGRRDLQWSIIKKLERIRNKYPRQPEQKQEWAKISEEIYNHGAAIVHNLNRALYYARQLAGSEKDMMFPDPCMIFYDIWQLLYILVVCESDYGDCHLYDEAVEEVKKLLSSCNLRHFNTPANLYEFNNVSRRTIAALQETQQVGDVSNRARTEALQTRYYLADDFEDHRFHIDWSLIQMYSSIAGILKQHVEESSDNLKKKDCGQVA